MVEIIEGIVIKTSDYQEKSKILQVFTKEHGLIGIYLRGANQYKNKSFAISQPITHAFFNIRYTSGLSSCYQGELVESYHSLKIDFDKNVYVYHLFELIYKNIEQHQPIPYLYDVLRLILKKMDETNDLKEIKILTIFFELKLLYFIGVFPELSHCVECGDHEHIANFDISRGGFVCQDCQNLSQKPYSIETLQTLYQLFYQNLENIHYDITDSILSELRQLVFEYFAYHLNMKTNASKYFQN